MAITLPSAAEIDEYSAIPEPRPSGPLTIPLIVDEEAVCRVRVLETGSGSFWSQGDVDVHVLHAKQHRLVDGLVEGLAPQAWLATALRERREQRRRLLRSGVRTTTSGLVVFHNPNQLLIPSRPTTSAAPTTS